MKKCNSCNNENKDSLTFKCNNCGATMCEDCANQTMRICPYCYSDLDYEE